MARKKEKKLRIGLGWMVIVLVVLTGIGEIVGGGKPILWAWALGTALLLTGFALVLDY